LFEATRAHQLSAPPMAVVLPGVGYWVSPDQWCACDICYGRLMLRDYDSIVADVVSSFPEQVRPAVSSLLNTVYRLVSVIQ